MEKFELQHQVQVKIKQRKFHVPIKIHGWLKFCLFIIFIGSVMNVLNYALTYDPKYYGGYKFVVAIEIFMLSTLFIIGNYAIYAFIKMKSNAVFYAKLYFILTLLINILSSIGTEKELIGFSIFNIIPPLIWFFYLTFSTQVKDRFPKEVRKLSKKDYTILAFFIITAITLFCAGVNEFNTRTNQLIKETDLSENERSDGRVIFKIPTGFTISEKHIINNLTIFSLKSENNDAIIITSNLDTDTSQENFNKSWESAQIDELSKCELKEIKDETIKINDNLCILRTSRYQSPTPVTWQFALIFHKFTNKVCMVSYYTFNDNQNEFENFLKSIRFE